MSHSHSHSHQRHQQSHTHETITSATTSTSTTSGVNIPSISSDSETYDANHSNSPEDSEEPRSHSSPSSSPLILYSPPTFWSIVRGAAINLILPFVNGLMLGFGELVAHEFAWRLGWGGTKVFPAHRNSRPVGPGVEMKEDVVERKRRSGEEMDQYTALE